MSKSTCCLSNDFLKKWEMFRLMWRQLKVFCKSSPQKVLFRLAGKWWSERTHLKVKDGNKDQSNPNCSYIIPRWSMDKSSRLRLSLSAQTATALDQLWTHIWWSFLAAVEILPSSVEGNPNWQGRKSRWSLSSMKRVSHAACEFLSSPHKKYWIELMKNCILEINGFKIAEQKKNRKTCVKKLIKC